MDTNFPFLRRLDEKEARTMFRGRRGQEDERGDYESPHDEQTEQDGEVLAEVTMRLSVGGDFIDDGVLADATLESWIRGKLEEDGLVQVESIDASGVYD